MLESTLALHGINLLREIEEKKSGLGSSKIDSNKIVAEAMKKKTLINQRAEEDQKSVVLQQLIRQQEAKAKMEKQEVVHVESKDDSSDEDIQIIMSQASQTLPIQRSQSHQ